MDDDDKNSEDEAAEPARDAAQEEDAKLRKVSEEDLQMKPCPKPEQSPSN